MNTNCATPHTSEISTSDNRTRHRRYDLSPGPPKVSVVLPTYNGAKYIRQSIDSVLKQTLSDLELIVVDDCSTDETPEIVLAVSDPRITYLRNPQNLKLPRSLNRGFAIASGEYLTWTSDDNWYAPNALERMATALDLYAEIALVCANRILVYEDDGRMVRQVLFPAIKTPERNCVMACFMYRRKVLETIGGYNPDALLIEDYEYWVRIHNRFRIGTINEDLYYYRMHEDSLSSQYGEEHVRRLHNEVAKRVSSRKRKFQLRLYSQIARWSERGSAHKYGSVLAPVRFVCKGLLKSYRLTISLP